MFIYSQQLILRFGHSMLFHVSHYTMILRLLLMSTVTQDTYWWIPFIQLSHGLCFALMWIAAVDYAFIAAPQELKSTRCLSGGGTMLHVCGSDYRDVLVLMVCMHVLLRLYCCYLTYGCCCAVKVWYRRATSLLAPVLEVSSSAHATRGTANTKQDQTFGPFIPRHPFNSSFANRVCSFRRFGAQVSYFIAAAMVASNIAFYLHNIKAPRAYSHSDSGPKSPQLHGKQLPALEGGGRYDRWACLPLA